MLQLLESITVLYTASGTTERKSLALVEGEILLVNFSWTNLLVLLFLRFLNVSSFQHVQIDSRELSSDFLQPFQNSGNGETLPQYSLGVGFFSISPSPVMSCHCLQASSNTTHAQGEGTAPGSPARWEEMWLACCLKTAHPVALPFYVT